jgi:high affinity Mn2+ porin
VHPESSMRKILFLLAIFSSGLIAAQTDSTEKWSWHFQFTGIMQGHPGFHVPYSGQNSLDSTREKAFSVTSTFFLGRRMWKGGELYFNPEIAGGKGISSALGIAGFTNGECFRIGDPSPAVYIARIFLRQTIALKGEQEWNESGANQLAGWTPENRLTFTAGKFSIADVYDCNSYSHDPRTQFMNWSLMSNGAWDYPANTRGYTWGVISDLKKGPMSFRLSATMLPKYANGSVFDHNLAKANGISLEIERRWGKENHAGAIRLLGFRNVSRAGNYLHAIEQLRNGVDSSMNVNTLTTYGGSKTGFGINAEQQLNEHLGIFLRASWNDGKSATWVFTEIDQNAQIGLQLDGVYWKRKNDVFGAAVSVNGISKDHAEFLNAGGYGFIIGDGKLPHYGMEEIAETYYSAQLAKNLWLSVDYQFVNNPAYNRDRGPVHVWAVRGHVAF